MALIKHARRELQTELGYEDVGYAIITQTAAKGRLLDTLDMLATLASVRSLPSAVKCALQHCCHNGCSTEALALAAALRLCGPAFWTLLDDRMSNDIIQGSR